MSRVFLIAYGLGRLGRFASAEPLVRDERVWVRSPRGQEPGTVLAEVPGPSQGIVVERWSAADDVLWTAACAQGQAVLAAAEAWSPALPVQFLDVEVIVEPRQAILHAVRWDECDLANVLSDLSARFGLTVQLDDLTTVPSSGCSTCGGSKGGGCSACGAHGSTCGSGCGSGSCVRNAVRSPDELTAWFAKFRVRMERSAARISLHQSDL